MTSILEEILLSPTERLALVRSLNSEALHELARLYNVNDGFLPYLQIISNPNCDAGTAAYIYWQFHELVADSDLRLASQGKDADWNAEPILATVEERYPSRFNSNSIAADLRFIDPDADYLADLIAGCRNLKLVKTLLDSCIV